MVSCQKQYRELIGNYSSGISRLIFKHVFLQIVNDLMERYILFLCVSSPRIPWSGNPSAVLGREEGVQKLKNHVW